MSSPRELLERIELDAMAIRDGRMIKANADDISVAVDELGALLDVSTPESARLVAELEWCKEEGAHELRLRSR